MKKIAVIYKSIYGTTEQYAKWIAEELGADLFKNSNIDAKKLNTYDVVVYGGGLYSGGIDGVDLVTKNHCKNLVVFTVGLSNPSKTDYTHIINKNFQNEMIKNIKVFHLRGGIDYKKLGVIHKIFMAMFKTFIVKKKNINGNNDEVKIMLETYGKKVNFTNKETIEPIIKYVCSL